MGSRIQSCKQQPCIQAVQSETGRCSGTPIKEDVSKTCRLQTRTHQACHSCALEGVERERVCFRGHPGEGWVDERLLLVLGACPSAWRQRHLVDARLGLRCHCFFLCCCFLCLCAGGILFPRVELSSLDLKQKIAQISIADINKCVESVLSSCAQFFSCARAFPANRHVATWETSKGSISPPAASP